MGRRRLTGLTIGKLGGTWEHVETDREVVRRVLTFLEDRRLLWRSPHNHAHVEEAEHCRRSAEMIRDRLGEEIGKVKHGGDVEASFKKIRKAARDFVSAAGPDSRNFVDLASFNEALSALRVPVCREILVLADHHDLDVDEDLLRVLPPRDLSFIPGFSDDDAQDGQ